MVRAACAAALIVISAVSVAMAQNTDPSGGLDTSSEVTNPAAQINQPSTDVQKEPREDTWLKAEDIGALQARSSALLLSGQKGGTVEGVLQWTVSPLPGDESGNVPFLDVPFLIEVEGAALVADHKAGRVPIGIYAYVMTLDGKLVAHQTQGLVVDAERWSDPLRNGGLRFFGRLQLQPGTYSLRVMVRNHKTQDYFLTWSEILIPEPSGGALNLLPPVFWDPSAVWVTALQNDLGEKEALAAFFGGGLSPAGRASIPEGKGADFLLVVAGAGEEQPHASARIIDEAGRTVAEPELVISNAPIPAKGTTYFRHATMKEIDLPPGDYEFVLEVETSDQQRARRTVPMTVTAGDQPLAWVQRQAEPDTAPKSPIAPEDRLAKRKMIRHEYLAALDLLAGGDVLGARRAVADLERRVIAVGKGSVMMTLRSIEQTECIKVAKIHPLALMPVIDLHRQLHRTYTVRHESSLAMHALMITADLAEITSKYQPDDIPAGFAETTLVGLANDLVQSSEMGSAQTMLERCLQINPSHEAALLALGAAYERFGAYDEAARVLVQLTKAYPDNLEAKLRFAVNSARTGNDSRANRLFRELIDSNDPTWITVIAYQELARTLLARGRVVEAVDLLREGVAQNPENQRLKIQLSFALDQADRRLEATGMLQALSPANRSEGETPRYRYSKWPLLSQMAQSQFGGTQSESALKALAEGLALEKSRSGP